MRRRRGKIGKARIRRALFKLAPVALLQRDAFRLSVARRKFNRSFRLRQRGGEIQHTRLFGGPDLSGLYQRGHAPLPALLLHVFPVGREIGCGLFRLLLRLFLSLFGIGSGAFRLLSGGFGRIQLLLCRLKLCGQHSDLFLQFLNSHMISLVFGGKIHRYAIFSARKLHGRKPVNGRLRRAQKPDMAQGHAVRHQAHAHMAVMPFSHDFPDFARNLRERRKQSAVFALELFRPPVGGRVQRRMPEHQRRITFFRVIGTGYGVQVLPRERLLPPVCIRERPGAGNLNPFFVVHTILPLLHILSDGQRVQFSELDAAEGKQGCTDQRLATSVGFQDFSNFLHDVRQVGRNAPHRAGRAACLQPLILFGHDFLLMKNAPVFPSP